MTRLIFTIELRKRSDSYFMWRKSELQISLSFQTTKTFILLFFFIFFKHFLYIYSICEIVYEIYIYMRKGTIHFLHVESLWNKNDQL